MALLCSRLTVILVIVGCPLGLEASWKSFRLLRESHKISKLSTTKCVLPSPRRSYRPLQNLLIVETTSVSRKYPSLPRHFWTRGGGTDEIYTTDSSTFVASYTGEEKSEDDIDDDDPFSKFIESFQSDLAEMRREVEAEAKSEIQSLSNLIHQQNAHGEGSTKTYLTMRKRRKIENNLEEREILRQNWLDVSAVEPLKARKNISGEEQYSKLHLETPEAKFRQSQLVEEANGHTFDEYPPEQVGSFGSNETGGIINLEEENLFQQNAAISLVENETQNQRMNNAGIQSQRVKTEKIAGEACLSNDLSGATISEGRGGVVDYGGKSAANELQANEGTSTTKLGSNGQIVMTNSSNKDKEVQEGKFKKSKKRRNKFKHERVKERAQQSASKSTKIGIRGENESLNLGDVDNILEPTHATKERADVRAKSIDTSCCSGNETALFQVIRRLIKSELARALFLFIATVISSIWLQRLQRHMESQGM